MNASKFACIALASAVLGLGLGAHAQNSTPATTEADKTPPALARQQAQEIAQGDPARWYQEDITPQDKLRTKRKENEAALRENLENCKAMAAPAKRSCEQDARSVYQQDMAKAQQAAMAGR